MKNNYIDKLPDDAKRIPNSESWITPDGHVYGMETRVSSGRWNTYPPVKHKYYGKYFEYSSFVNKHNGYVYVPVKHVKEDGKYDVRQRRLHILLAEAFLENPNDYPVVGHRNNIKSDNRLENLYWTTISENTKKAFNDGLAKNAKGYDDSQSKPVYMYDTYTNELLGSYGSCTEAAKETGITLGTITRQAKYKRPVRKPFYFRFQDDASNWRPPIVIQYDLATGKELGRYFNTWEASRRTGISSKTIECMCKNNKVPNWSKSGTYFLYRE